MPARRKILVPYRGAQSEMLVTSVHMETEVRLAALLKHASVESGYLPELVFEDSLADKSCKSGIADVEPKLIEKFLLARVEANKILELA